jgi:hypothetical protein
LDCDGVLADFDSTAEAILGLPSGEAQQKLGAKRFWKTLHSYDNFYGTLPLLPDALKLFKGRRASSTHHPDRLPLEWMGGVAEGALGGGALPRHKGDHMHGTR